MKTLDKSKSGRMAGVAFAGWLVVCLGAMLGIAKYSTSPGAEQGGPKDWPADSRVALARTNLTLVMLAHPQCPCTEATMGELDRLMTRASESVFWQRRVGSFSRDCDCEWSLDAESK